MKEKIFLHKRMRFPVTPLFLGVLFMSLFLFSCGGEVRGGKFNPARKGVIDLRQWNPAEGVIRLDGEWNIYWKRLLDPKKEITDETALTIQVPAPWNDLELPSGKAGGAGYATCTLRILLPPGIKRLGIMTADHSSAVELFASGKKIAAAGDAAAGEDYIPRYGPFDTYFSIDKPEFLLVAHVTNFHHRKGGLWNPFFLGSEKKIRQRFCYQTRLDWFIFGSLMVMGFYLFGLYFLRREETAPLFLSVTLFLIAFYAMHTGEIPFPGVSASTSFEINRKLTYLSIYFSLFFLLHFIHAAFTREFSRRVLRLFRVVILIPSLLVVILPMSLASYTMPFFQAVAIVSIFYIIFVLIRAVRARRKGALIMLVGIFFLFLIVLNDILYANHILHFGQLLELGLFFIILSNSLLLSIQFMQTFRKIETLSAELENVNDELVEKNLDLDRDIRIREEAEKNLQQTWTFLRTVFDSISSILIAVDREKSITQVNRASSEITGKDISDIIGLPLLDVFPLLAGYAADIEDVMETGIGKKYDGIILQHGLEIMTVQMSVSPVSYDDKSGAVISIDDITELARKREELKQAQKMETIGNLAGGIAHDFNNILAGIVGAVSLLRMSLSDPEAREESFSENISYIEEASKRASHLVEQILTLSRKHEVKIDPVDLNKVVEQVVGLLSNTIDKSIVISTHYADVPAIVYADSIQLVQVLLNICINAAHAMTFMREAGCDYGGELTMAVKKEENFSIARNESGDIQLGNSWVVEVTDTGVGIEPAILSRIFDPFFSTKQIAGTGLGLAISYNIIESFRGFIEVESEPGAGTCFRVIMPEFIGLDEEVPHEEKGERKLYHGSGTVLVVDDEDMVRTTTKKFIHRCGYDVITASSGREGIEAFRQNSDVIKLVMLDMVMPGISGLEVYRILRDMDPAVRVLLTSGFHGDERVQETIRQGVEGFIKKPYTLEELSAKLHEILG